ncbi:phenylacetate-CoA oxygenase subunit PaaJ [Rhodohalobacter sp. SW132]|uniref:1,2-phenylacetyl-CoA epoxidase subunit PaaD n=1 Tax=Rhodohalobacter sp. SW132 TaxID=2293433 RepID=UPI000E288B16|nr:1,2-phenylacetyl-CoA epoxidase subunit PaaD [Rhodohalobacter sp. SW132]REL38151.1 phenylacetate-CoA oxygenase subunit PaaJ [Rhodohalobacter sp. SW132]
MNETKTLSKEKLWTWLEEVIDPEIPVLNVVEMGIVRNILLENSEVIVKITPTYSGCPAMNAIEMEIRKKLREKGIEEFKVITDFKEPWTTDWMTDHAKKKLKEYGIAPPDRTTGDDDFLTGLKNSQKIIPCPYCDSMDTELQSEFGSTACKSLYFCDGCSQPFEHFKCI